MIIRTLQVTSKYIQVRGRARECINGKTSSWLEIVVDGYCESIELGVKNQNHVQ